MSLCWPGQDFQCYFALQEKVIKPRLLCGQDGSYTVAWLLLWISVAKAKAALAKKLQLGGIGLFSAEMAGAIGSVGADQAWAALEAFRGR